jgi:hypothetical protein
MNTAENMLSETLIGLWEAGRQLPPGRQGRPVSFSCVLRWITRGLPGPDGQKVRLEAIRVGGRWLTSKEALARWAGKLTPRLDCELVTKQRTPTQRCNAAERAGKRLEKVGI